MIIALNGYVASRLSECGVEKEYVAIAEGEYSGEGTIDKPIYRPDPMKTIRATGETGDRAVTHYKAEVTDGKRTVLRVRLETGRTHQIRVHFASMGTPLTGDSMYGKADPEITRQALHCGKIIFIHPVTQEKIEVNAPLWEDMQKIYEKICENNKF